LPYINKKFNAKRVSPFGALYREITNCCKSTPDKSRKKIQRKGAKALRRKDKQNNRRAAEPLRKRRENFDRQTYYLTSDGIE
jgi:hypothetical protein